jgi:hypothetical protein
MKNKKDRNKNKLDYKNKEIEKWFKELYRNKDN